MMENELIYKFINASIKYGEYQQLGNSRGVNKQSKIISEVEMDLMKQGEHSIELLINCLEHENKYVRLHSSLSVLKFERNKAKKVLIELTKEKGLIATEARIILSQLEKGIL